MKVIFLISLSVALTAGCVHFPDKVTIIRNCAFSLGEPPVKPNFPPETVILEAEDGSVIVEGEQWQALMDNRLSRAQYMQKLQNYIETCNKLKTIE